MDLSIIIVSFNTKDLTLGCIKSVIKNTKGIEYEIIVVDNGSNDGSIEIIKNLKRITDRPIVKIKNYSPKLKIFQNQMNLGFGKANNQGMNIAKGKYILLLNSDTLINDNFLPEIVSWMDRNKDVGIVSCSLKNIDGSTQGTGGYFPTLLRVFSWMTIQDFPLVDKVIKPFHPMHQLSFSKGEGFYEKERELDWVTGAFLLMRRYVYKQTGGFDEDYFMYTEEVDLCFRAKKNGWKVYYLPQWSITHHGGASGNSWSHVIPEYQGVKIFYKKHYPKWQYFLLRLILKIGALGRIFLFGVLKGKEAAKVYVKALQIA